MQTSIEWFIEHLLGNGLLRLTKDDHNLYSELRDKAKEMHKQEIDDAFQDGKWDWSEHINNGTESKDLAQYYQEKYKKD
jgi:hypothetical protein